ncbi:substrate-binding domain-containing protein [Teredinibacter franksiae]|uniref:substrate-binding domain-containing protein n=1 Tax=Teredinibacter franksiae TaxID=2761453 RepID=UPI0016259569|nr:substrate-binding domain-containing protein [Teredinibacter franksiae]
MLVQQEHPIHIAVLTPYLQGDYMGEIINQIRHICELKQYQFTAIRTDGFGSFNLAIGLEQFSAVIVIRNAANPKLVEKIQNRGIPVVAIAHDYFPLEVPVVTCDNNLGAELAFDHLRAKGHRNMVFIGDITQYDLRKRYERFCELLKLHDLPCGTAQLICAPDTIFSGGLAAGAEFFNSASNCTGVFCGAGHTAMGFVKQLEAAGIHVPEDLDVVTFDSIRMMKVLTPQLTCIDQNLDLLAHRCIASLEGMLHGGTLPTKAITIAPTLCPAEQVRDIPREESSRNGTTGSLSNPNYTSSLLNNAFEMTRDIVDSRLDKIMGVAPLFSEYMAFGVLSCVIYDRKRRPYLYTHKIFEPTETLCIAGNGTDVTHRCLPEEFPPPAIRSRLSPPYDTWVHFPVFCEDTLWGVLSFVGVRKHAHHNSSFSSFTSFIDNISFSYAKMLEISSLKEELKRTEADSPQIHRVTGLNNSLPSFEWDLEKGSVQWSDLALELLGFTTELEKNIYRNMEIFDRVHPEDESKLRKELTNSLSKLGDMTTAARLKNAGGDFHQYSLQGEILHEENSRAIHYRCCLSLIN